MSDEVRPVAAGVTESRLRAPLPRIETERLVLRELRMEDAPAVQRWAGDRDIAAMTATIPHPYEDGMAEEWIRGNSERAARGEAVSFAIEETASGQLIGTVGLVLHLEHDRGELGYWIGKPWWGRGIATEASRPVLRYGFETLRLNRIYASYFSQNVASGRVMEKLGMRYEGESRQHLKKWGVYQDLKRYSILHSEYDADTRTD